MTIVYVQRGVGGAIIGVFGVAQPGYADDAIDDDHADVAVFRNRPQPEPRNLAAEVDALKAQIARTEAAEAVLIEKAIVTKGEIDAKVPAREVGDVKG